MALARNRVDEIEHAVRATKETVGGREPVYAHMCTRLVVLRDEFGKATFGLFAAGKMLHVPQFAFHCSDQRLDLATTLWVVTMSDHVIDELGFEILFELLGQKPTAAVSANRFRFSVASDRVT